MAPETNRRRANTLLQIQKQCAVKLERIPLRSKKKVRHRDVPTLRAGPRWLGSNMASR